MGQLKKSAQHARLSEFSTRPIGMSVKKQLSCRGLHIYLLLQASIQKYFRLACARARVLEKVKLVEIVEEISGHNCPARKSI